MKKRCGCEKLNLRLELRLAPYTLKETNLSKDFICCLCCRNLLLGSCFGGRMSCLYAIGSKNIWLDVMVIQCAPTWQSPGNPFSALTATTSFSKCVAGGVAIVIEAGGGVELWNRLIRTRFLAFTVQVLRVSGGTPSRRGATPPPAFFLYTASAHKD